MSLINASTTSGAKYSAEPTGVHNSGVVTGVAEREFILMDEPKSKSHIFTGITELLY
jgi:hypothetical protein